MVGRHHASRVNVKYKPTQSNKPLPKSKLLRCEPGKLAEAHPPPAFSPQGPLGFHSVISPKCISSTLFVGHNSCPVLSASLVSGAMVEVLQTLLTVLPRSLGWRCLHPKYQVKKRRLRKGKPLSHAGSANQGQHWNRTLSAVSQGCHSAEVPPSKKEGATPSLRHPCSAPSWGFSCTSWSLRLLGICSNHYDQLLGYLKAVNVNTTSRRLGEVIPISPLCNL